MLYYGHANKDNINPQMDEIIWGKAFFISLSDTLPMKSYYV